MSDLITIIYRAVEILGGLAIIVIVVSYVTYKLKTKSELKPFEREIDKENELKVVIKDEKNKKDIVKGALEKTDSHKSKQSSGSKKSSRTSEKDHKRVNDKEKSSHKSTTHSSRSHSTKSHSSNHSLSSSKIKISKPKRPLPSRDKRIQVLNKLHHTRGADEIVKIQKKKNDNKNENQRKTNGNGFSKFYDENEE